MNRQCGAVNFWWETGSATRCRRPHIHRGAHCDGLYWWNSDGIRVTGTGMSTERNDHGLWDTRGTNKNAAPDGAGNTAEATCTPQSSTRPEGVPSP